MDGILENIVRNLENASNSFKSMEEAMHGIFDCMKNKESMEREAEREKKLFEVIESRQDVYQKQVEALLSKENEKIIGEIGIITNYFTNEKQDKEIEINELKKRIQGLEEKILDYQDAVKMEEYEFYKGLKQQGFENLCKEMRIKITGYEEFVSSCSKKDTIVNIYNRMQMEMQKTDDQRNKEETDMLEELLNYCLKCHSRVNRYTLSRQNIKIGDNYNSDYHQKREMDKSSGEIRSIYLQGIQYGEQNTIFESCKAYVGLN